MRKNIIIKGMPKSGKSTLLKKIAYDQPNKFGFITNEIKENEKRIGFEMEDSLGNSQIIAHIDFNTNIKVGKYFVNIDNLEKGLEKIKNFQTNDFLYLDEIAQMQLYSENFQELTLKYLDSPNTCIATLKENYPHEFIKNLKERKDIFLIELTEENRLEKEEYIRKLIKKIEKAKRYSSEIERFALNENQAKIKTDSGIRNLIYENNTWKCECDFFNKYDICSHKIALEEIIKNKT